MKKILLLSDTHHYIDDAIINYCNQTDQIWHAGDIGSLVTVDKLNATGKLIAVYGNIDDASVRQICPMEQFFICEGLKILMIHIGGYPGRYAPGIKDRIRTLHPDIFICGHSHVLKIMRDTNNKMLHINPGAAGVHGFHQTRTMVRFKIENGSVLDVEVIELGPRSTKSVSRTD